jgi:WD40 repeat protein
VVSKKRKEETKVGRHTHRGEFTTDGKLLVTGENDRDTNEFRVRVWDVAAGKERSILTGKGALSDLAVNQDGRVVASRCWDGAVTVWDVASGKERLRLGLAHPAGGCRVLALNPSGTVLAAGEFGEKVIKLWAVPGGK